MATFIYMNQICFIDYIAHRLYYNGKFIYINQICLNTSKKKANSFDANNLYSIFLIVN